MAEQTIIRTQIIGVKDVGQNSYGDLTFTDEVGAEYKVSAKRKQYFEKVIIPGRAVLLHYAMSSFGKEYIYKAATVGGDAIPAPSQPPAASSVSPLPVKPPVANPSEKYKADPARPTRQYGKSPEEVVSIEHQVAIKEIGELIRSKIIPVISPLGVRYFEWLAEQVNVNLKGEPNVSESSEPAIPTTVVAKVEADKMENRGTEESPGTDSNKNEQRKQERNALVERLNEHNWSVGKAVFTLNKTGKYNLSTIDNISDYDQAYRELAAIEKWEK